MLQLQESGKRTSPEDIGSSLNSAILITNDLGSSLNSATLITNKLSDLQFQL